MARQLDPLSLAIATDNGEILYFSRQYDRSIQKLRDVQQMEPGFIRSHIIVNAYTAKGMFSEAFADIEQWRKTIDQPWSWAELAYVSGRSGHVRDARSAVNKLLELNKHQPIDASLLFWAYTGMGDREHAFEWLEKAYGQRANILLRLRVDPAFDSLRGDPRFQNFLARVHLAD